MESAPQQTELFDIAEVAGYGVLTKREREFVRALFEGCSQREAARRAGFEGSEEVLDAAASRAVRNVKVQKLMNQAWSRAGGSIDLPLRQAAEMATRAFAEWQAGRTAEQRREARKEWLAAVMFIAQVHGKIKPVGNTSVVVNVVSDEARAQLAELARQGVEIAMPQTAGGRN